MLPKINRLNKKRDFEKVFKKGQGFQGDFLFLKRSANNLATSRFGIIVSQKVAKKAVARNKLRRRLANSLEKSHALEKKGVDVVLVAKPGLEKKSFQELQNILESLLERAGLVNH